mmetsp:Transcript_41016/g.41892  ORF Transcript_41016/g.41892 Transcript_41016/m.41892 type:complete len:325 (+) Transcript_41016:133-1107(+)|eukprot:CAMPEP_0182430450 /NCGR_PEP_ID=MMETSP1167-20130531/40709_1 /TAXON_ID=2988 /ORGANISM="Mallomonas Sp, Strain CCMP3275" /LENGTH=324 /DNA_ID=CAMNT_0024615559 /DNA_START=86 /DNA_END=1060 /DNA_ORIENTATION=-
MSEIKSSSTERAFLMDGQEISNFDINFQNHSDNECDNNDDELDENQYDENEDDDINENGDDDEENELSSVMPEKFYEGVEEFLSRPPPKLSVMGNGNKKISLPKLKQEKLDLQKQMRLNPGGPVHASTKTATKKIAKKKESSSASGVKQIDEQLLMQAMEYTDKLMNEELIDKMRELSSTKNMNTNGRRAFSQGHVAEGTDDKMTQKGRNRSKDSNDIKRKANGTNTRVGVGGGGPVKRNSVVKKLRAQTRIYSHDNEFSISTADSGQDPNKSNLDFEAMITNFEQGITLRKLQAELEDSKINMMRSEDVVKKISAEYYRKISR